MHYIYIVIKRKFMNDFNRQNGFYFVVFDGETTIARCTYDTWMMVGSPHIYREHEFDDIDFNNPVYVL